jgi:hypothetical protein
VDENLFSQTFIHSLRRVGIESWVLFSAAGSDSCRFGDATHTPPRLLTPQPFRCMQRQECAVDNGHLA